MINWKLRLQNKTTLLSLCITVIAFVYQIFGLLGIVPAITEEMITQLITLIINLFATVGILVDPTTAGICDSKRALEYKEPYVYTEEGEDK